MRVHTAGGSRRGDTEAIKIEVTDDEAAEFAPQLRRRKGARADVMRAEIVLLAARGLTSRSIAERLGITRVTIAAWRTRFAEKRLGGGSYWVPGW